MDETTKQIHPDAETFFFFIAGAVRFSQLWS